MFKPGIFNDANGLVFLQGVLSQFAGYKRKVSVAAVNANTGEETMFTESNTSWSDFAQAALSSSSVPGIFPP
jgi:predicted acylesterase/phospholipase RssA